MTVPRQPTTQRRAMLLAAVRGGDRSIAQLADQFDVSPSTIRRDLTELAREGHVVRTYGGALDAGTTVERTLREKDASNSEEKDAVAKAAADLVDDGEVVLLDAGTTTGRLARYLAGRQGLTVVTNGLTVLLALADSTDVDVIVLGGRLRHPNEAILGPSVESQLRHITPDKVFLGADGITAGRGLSCPTLEQAQLKHAMLHVGRGAYVLVDHSKLDTGPFAYWAPLDREHTIVVDEGAGKALDAFAAVDGCEVLAVPY
ncbi:DeoR family transcriptional regulator [Prauserella marina]|uniref:DNA-binding transcriptional regulator of sugar metabolism, DeoR/GlpR family n=1 Tax=Prauserella marina TaxID=530584 RepID=A0A222VUX6_9PSEU|nr:DeoR/GlpR family DNA-binding transcription regulator [Prauserella marina]ASR37727.1 DeoR family transcriptional regulator [Prauserella marina]PWV75667.1 DeoR family transcriptional regulator [Prauserella marina]SDD29260.1 DNA-binding transcriptional regulator of sugar metabolism, DeoR/GlpR family [Prauserella marina]